MKLTPQQILDVLKCESLAQAVNEYSLGECQGNIWQHLEVEAFSELRRQRRQREFNRVLSLLK